MYSTPTSNFRHHFQLSKILTIALFIVAHLTSTQVVAQTPSNVSVSTATLVNTFPFTDSNVNTSLGGSNTTMQGGCVAACCSTVIYKIVIPTFGTLRGDLTNYTPLANSMLAYTPTVSNPSSGADLTYYSALGNFCGFRDSVQLSNLSPGDIFYIYVFGHNNQTGQGTNTNIIFDFIPDCPSGYVCGYENTQSCSDTGFLSPNGNRYFTSGTYQDTIVQTGADSIHTTVLTVQHKSYSDTLADLSVCESSVKSPVFTNKTAFSSYQKTDEDYVVCDSVVDDIAGTDRSVFTWMRQTSTVSSTSQMLVAINSSSGGNICNLQIAIDEKLEVYDGDNSRSTGVVVTDGQWHHVGYTYDETTDSTWVYIDGVIEKRYKNGQSVTSTGKLSLGQEYDGGLSTGNFYDGEMTEVSIWNTVLTEADVQEIMKGAIKSSHAKYSNLKAYYPMSIACGEDVTVVADASGNNNQGHTMSVSGDKAEIQFTDSLVTIPNFDATDHYSFDLSKDGSAVGHTVTNDSVTLSVNADAEYVFSFVKDYVTIRDTLDLLFYSITSQPEDEVCLAVGDTAIFTVDGNKGDMTYQWYVINDIDSIITKTTSDGLGGMGAKPLYGSNGIIYVATSGGLSISTDGGASFTNRTTSSGLGHNLVRSLHVSNGTIYAGTNGGLSISTDGGTSFTNKTTSNGLGSNEVVDVHVSNGTIYAATYVGGLSISTDGGATFVNKTTSHGLGSIYVRSVDVSNGTIYVGTNGGLSISTNGGTSFTNKTKSDGLGDNIIYSVDLSNGTIYAGNAGGLSISTDGGASFINRTTADGLLHNSVNSVQESNGNLYLGSGIGMTISTDGGTSFTKRILSGFGSIINVQEINGIVYIGSNTGGLLVIKDKLLINGATNDTLSLNTITGSMDSTRYIVEAYSLDSSCTILSDTVRLTICDACKLTNNLPTNAGTYTATAEATDGSYVCYCDADGKLLLALDTTGTGAVIAASGVKLEIGSDTTTSWTTAGGIITNTKGGAIINRKWDVSPTTQPTSDVKVKYFFTEAEYQALKDTLANHNGGAAGYTTTLSSVTSLQLYKLTSTGVFADPHGSGAAGIVLTSGSTPSTTVWKHSTHGTVDHTAEYLVSSFSGGGGGGGAANTALPVDLIYFSAKGNSDHSATIHWSTASEINNSHFVLYRSYDGVDFEEVTVVSGNGNSNETIEYSFHDQVIHTSENVVYYQLKQVDYNGDSELSAIRKVIIKGTDLKVNSIVYPNPSNDKFYVLVDNSLDETVEVNLTDMNGRVLYSTSGSGAEAIEISAKTLGIGVYILEITSGQYVERVRIVKE